MAVTIGLAFIAGLASFLSPCVFSLVPVYIGYLSGRSVASYQESESSNRLQTFIHGLFFVLGFSLIFILLGLAISALGGFLYNIRDLLAKLGGIIVILFGLHMTGLLKIPFLNYDLRPRSKTERNRSYLSSFLMGIFFSAGWSPCVGPVLGAILMLALNEGSVLSGLWLLSAYSAGMAIPFLAAAAATGWVTHLLRDFRSVMYYIEIIMGVLLILVGVLLFLGIFEQLAGLGSFINLGL